MALPVKHYGKWRIRWLDEKGQRGSETFDDYKTALAELRRHEAHAEEARRGLRVAEAPLHKTVGDALDFWVTNVASMKRSKDADESIIRVHLRPAFGHVRLRDLSPEHIGPFKLSKKSLNEKTLNNILTLLISVLRNAVELGWLLKVPRIKKPKIDVADESYRWLRTDAEIQRLLSAAREIGELPFMFYATALYTGMRQGELAGLRRDCVDLERRQIKVTRSYDGPTKSKKTRHVPILDPLLPLLRAWLLKTPGELVFPNEAGKMHGQSSRLFQEMLHRTLDGAGFPKTVKGEKTRWYIRFHDLRHTFASHWVQNGGDIFRLQKILGHQSMILTQRYAHLAPDAFAADYARLGTAAPAEAAKVIPLRQAAGATE